MSRKPWHTSRFEEKIPVIIILLVAIAVMFSAGMFTGFHIGYPAYITEIDEPNLYELPELSTAGFVLVEGVETDQLGAILKSGCYKLHMLMSEYQTYSIEQGLSGTRPYRPLTQDLMVDMFDIFDIDVMMVKIVSLSENTYYAKTIMKSEKRVLNMDSRPSDAIAIAVRTKAPLYINQTIMEENGENTCLSQV